MNTGKRSQEREEHFELAKSELKLFCIDSLAIVLPIDLAGGIDFTLFCCSINKIKKTIDFT